ncbi:MAG: aldehyde dehydrogenase family protein [Paludibaculum sp.]
MNPATQTIQRPGADASAIAEIVATQSRYFLGNSTKSIDFRLAQLSKLKQMLQANEEALQAAIQADYGKQAFDTFLTELFVIYDANRNSDGSEGVGDAEDRKVQPAELRREELYPSGTAWVSLVIGPWNYPYQLALCPVVAAMAAGCTIVLKPSELTPQSSGLLARLIRETFPSEYFAVVEGGVPETTALLAEKFDMIFFTGSVPVGRIVYQAAARHLTPVVLELGGKSPAIITPGVDLDETVTAAGVGEVPERRPDLHRTRLRPVHSSIEALLLERIRQELSKVGYSLENGNYARIVNERNASRVAAMIDPSKVFVGGGHDISERWIEPTVLQNVEWTDPVMQEEIFGPLLPVLVYDDLDDAIREIKARPKPLALYLFTIDEVTKQKVLGEVSFGGGCVNDALMHISNGNLPFGGVGDSGIGNYHGEAGFRAFSHYKSILDKDLTPDPDFKYVPHTEEKLAVFRQIIGS